MIEPLVKRHSHIGEINELMAKVEEIISVVNEMLEWRTGGKVIETPRKPGRPPKQLQDNQ